MTAAADIQTAHRIILQVAPLKDAQDLLDIFDVNCSCGDLVVDALAEIVAWAKAERRWPRRLRKNAGPGGAL